MKQLLSKFFWYILNHTYKWWPDSVWLRIIYQQKLHRKLNLRSPRRFTEKLQWLKLHDRNTLYPLLVDKGEVKNYISNKFGAEYVIPTYGIWDSFDQIAFERLPDQFVLKCTHDSGRVFICKDKRNFDKLQAKEVLEKSLKHNFFWWTREWPYKKVKGRILAEQYLDDAGTQSDGLTDYKFYCFNGKVEYCQVIKDRSSHETIDFYDAEWNHQDFIGLNINASHSLSPVCKPRCYAKMLEIASSLSEGIPFVRIDLYEVDDKVKFGEVTFYPASGLGSFMPDEYDFILGEKITVI